MSPVTKGWAHPIQATVLESDGCMDCNLGSNDINYGRSSNTKACADLTNSERPGRLLFMKEQHLFRRLLTGSRAATVLQLARCSTPELELES